MIERSEVEGRPAFVAYFDGEGGPADKGDCVLVKILFDDGEVLFVVPKNGRSDASWEESKHPRWPAGSPKGGKFMTKEEIEQYGSDPHEAAKKLEKEEGKEAPPSGSGLSPKARRIVETHPIPKELPERPDRYFKISQDTEFLPLDLLKMGKSPEEVEQSSENSAKLMRASFDGELEKRDPIHVIKSGNDYLIRDGNSTYTAAKKYGWKEIPVQVVGETSERSIFTPEELETPEGRQPAKTKEELFSMAKEALSSFVSWLDHGDGVAVRHGAKVVGKPPEAVSEEEWQESGPFLFLAPLKSEKRSEEKVNADYGGDWSRLTDVVRGTIALDSFEDVYNMLDALRSSGSLELARKPKDRFSQPTSVGYRDVLLNVRVGNGVIAELQLNVKPMMQAKNEMHHYYEIQRSLAAKYADVPVSEWSDRDKELYQTLVQKQTEEYNAAWQKALGK